MKKAIITSVFLFCVFYASQVHAISDLGGFIINDYHVDINVNEDGTFAVQERIAVDFAEQRHGIFRKIPVKYESFGKTNFKLRLNGFTVSDESGKGRIFKKYKESGNIVLKIGDPNTLVAGRQIYDIRYNVVNGLRFFDNHTELYWNPIGTQWPTTINNATVAVHLHRDLVLADDGLACFTGYYKSGARECTISVVSSNQIKFASKDILDPYEGLTIAMEFPTTFVQGLSFKEKLYYFLIDNWGFSLPIFVFAGMLLLWIARGKELDLGRTVIAQYEPPDRLTPGEVGYLMKEKYAANFVSADIVNLAVKGYLKIFEVEKKEISQNIQKIAKIIGIIIPIVVFNVALSFFLVDTFFLIVIAEFAVLMLFIFKLNSKSKPGMKNTKGVADYKLQNLKEWKDDESLTAHEKKLLDGLFGRTVGRTVVLSKLKNFYIQVEAAKKKIKKKMDALDYFEEDTIHKKSIYITIGVVVIIAGLILGLSAQRVDLLFGLPLSGVINIWFGIFMSKKTFDGIEAERHVKGLKQYIHTAERYRVKFQEDEHIFEKVLPYAMVLGMADKWAKAFEGIYTHNPEWYSSQAGSFTPIVFAQSMNNNFSNVARTVSTPPRSSSSSGFSGGGSSGGGGGGGGGGSW
ncbi:MAG: DUF2207 domain-containing protein [Patescibacteria group bacterium]|nr:DUF2207 domain-containing protein [Patescibacteria group bacterium]